jgi:hypothetical protein
MPLDLLSTTEDASSVTFECGFTMVAAHGHVALTHRALFEVYSDESNVFSIRTSTSDENFALTNGNPSCEFTL